MAVISLRTASRWSRPHYIKAGVFLQYELHKEGISEVDVTISYRGGIIFIEAKYPALTLVSPKATYGSKETR